MVGKVKDGYFDFLLFSSRYISGGGSLKDHRDVSRKRLLLAMCGASTRDEEALILWEQSNRFYQCVKNISSQKKFDLRLLCKINEALLTNHPKAGTIRTYQNWVGATCLEKARYVPPPPSELKGLLNNYIDFVNSNRMWEKNNVIRIYSELLKIHPFPDGNGRCARAIWLSLLETPEASIPHFLYRLVCKDDLQHDMAISKLPNDIDIFWDEMFSWQKNKTEQCIKYVRDNVNSVLNAMPLPAVSNKVYEIIIYFCNIPFFVIDGKSKIMNRFMIDMKYELEMLEENGVIKRRAIRSENKIIFECKVFYDMHIMLDEMIMN